MATQRVQTARQPGPGFEDEIAEAARDGVTTAKADLAPDPVDLASDRVMQVVNNVTSQALDQLRQMRDQTDELMQAIQDSHDTVVDDFQTHVRRVADAIKAKVVMAKGLEGVREAFKPAPGRTLTQTGQS